MVDVIADAVNGAIGESLGRNDAMVLDSFSIVRYVRIDEETGESYNSWCAILSDDTPITNIAGLFLLGQKWIDAELERMVDEE